jgi:DHA1 family multidrug resistance protein-like MFS transporter
MNGKMILYLSSFIFMLGVGSVVGTIPALAESIGLGQHTGLIISAWGFTYLLCNIPGGALVDRFGFKRIVPLAMLLNVFPGLLFLVGRSIGLLVLGRIIEGILEAFIWSGIIGEVSRSSGERRIVDIGRLFIATSLGFTIGPFIASLLQKLAVALPFLFYMLTSIFGGGLLLLTGDNYLRQPSHGPRREVLRFKFSPELFLALTVGLVESALPALSVPIAFEVGLSATDSGLLLTLYYFSGFIGQYTLKYASREVEGSLYPYVALFLGLVLFFSLGGFLELIGVFALGVINATLISRAQSLVTRTYEGNESLGSGTVNFSWSLGYSLGGLIVEAIRAPASVRIAMILALGLLLYLVGKNLKWEKLH